MAKIMNVQMKAMKSWESWEGCGTSANIYVNGKKAGTFLDEGRGGPIDVHFISKEFEELVNKKAEEYFTKHPPQFDVEEARLEGKSVKEAYDYMYDLEAFLEEVINLTEKEKAYKKMVKKGYPIMVTTSYPLFVKGPAPQPKWMHFGGPNAHINANKWINTEKESFPRLIVNVYGSENDFCIE